MRLDADARGGRQLDPMAVWDPSSRAMLVGGVSDQGRDGRRAFVHRIDALSSAGEPIVIDQDPTLDKGWLATVPVPTGHEIHAVFRNHRYVSSDAGLSWEAREPVAILQGPVLVADAAEQLLAGWDPAPLDNDGSAGDRMLVFGPAPGSPAFAARWRGAFSFDFANDELPGRFQAPRFPALALVERRGTADAVLARLTSPVGHGCSARAEGT